MGSLLIVICLPHLYYTSALYMPTCQPQLAVLDTVQYVARHMKFFGDAMDS